MVVISSAVLIGGALGLAGLGAGIGAMLTGGQKQSQELASDTSAKSEVKAPISQDVQPRYDQRDYSTIINKTTSNITDSPYASIGTDSGITQDKPMTQTPMLEIIQTPKQEIIPEIVQTPSTTQSAEQKQDPTGGMLMIGAVAVGGYLVYKEVTKKK